MIEVSLKIYFSFRNRLDNKGKITLEVPDPATVGEVLDEFTEKFPDFEDEIFEEPGEIKRFIQIRVNQKNITGIDGLNTELNEGDEIQILPKLGGG
ncbi:MAG: ubiquitin-like small modifier protein 1 [Candidatus Bipolaricaulota bacterium]|nr:MoaD family protein [Candidatus Bipolaricaulota bacterium]